MIEPLVMLFLHHSLQILFKSWKCFTFINPISPNKNPIFKKSRKCPFAHPSTAMVSNSTPQNPTPSKTFSHLNSSAKQSHTLFLSLHFISPNLAKPIEKDSNLSQLQLLQRLKKLPKPHSEAKTQKISMSWSWAPPVTLEILW